MATGERIDPYRGFNFRVEIAGASQAVAAFREVTGLTFTIDPIEYRDGNFPELHVKKLFGLRKYTNLGLKRGFTQNKELWVWYRNIVNGQADRRNGAIVLVDEEQHDVLRWAFYEAWICKWEGPAMNATTNEVAIEAVEFAVEKVELVA
jgi:phage tail-like protein